MDVVRVASEVARGRYAYRSRTMRAAFAVSFDLDDTLVSDNQLERTVALARLELLTAKDAKRFDRVAAETAIDDFLRSVRDSDCTTDEYIAEFYDRFAGAGNASTEAASDYRGAVVAAASKHVVALPGACELLAELDRSSIPYAMLTNGWSPLQEEKARLIGFTGRVFVSERIGARKPAPAAFAVMREHFALPCERIWHVGDNARADCAGATRAGMTSVWFDRLGQTYPSDIPAPDHVVRSLTELPALFVTARAYE